MKSEWTVNSCDGRRQQSRSHTQTLARFAQHLLLLNHIFSIFSNLYKCVVMFISQINFNDIISCIIHWSHWSANAPFNWMPLSIVQRLPFIHCCWDAIRFRCSRILIPNDLRDVTLDAAIRDEWKRTGASETVSNGGEECNKSIELFAFSKDTQSAIEVHRKWSTKRHVALCVVTFLSGNCSVFVNSDDDCGETIRNWRAAVSFHLVRRHS